MIVTVGRLFVDNAVPRIVGFVNVSAGFAQLVFFCFEPLACCCMGQDALRDGAEPKSLPPTRTLISHPTKPSPLPSSQPLP